MRLPIAAQNAAALVKRAATVPLFPVMVILI